MILQAQKKYQINLARSFMVGDSEKDIACARAAGCAKALLVKTGNGPAAYAALNKNHTAPDYFAEDLYDAACWIIKSAKH